MCRIFAIGGGKGGVGKSISAIAISIALAKKGYSVVLADLDLGAANLHTYLGITYKTPTIVDFILKRVTSLEDILVETSQKSLRFISGAEFFSGMANSPYWIKLKLIKHLKSLPVDFLVIDLGAGIHFNTLDFFNLADRGLIITVPEPGAVMNAYGFIKGALFRKLQSVFKNHLEIGAIIRQESDKAESKERFTLEWFSEKINELSPELLPLIDEVGKTFSPALIINRVSETQTHLLVKNLVSLCTEKLGISIKNIGNLPDVREIAHYLLDLPRFINTYEGRPFFKLVEKIVETLISQTTESKTINEKTDFSDEDIEMIIRFIDTLDERIFIGSSKNIWKLRMYFKPLDVLNFLNSKGITHEAFYRQAISPN